MNQQLLKLTRMDYFQMFRQGKIKEPLGHQNSKTLLFLFEMSRAITLRLSVDHGGIIIQRYLLGLKSPWPEADRYGLHLQGYLLSRILCCNGVVCHRMCATCFRIASLRSLFRVLRPIRKAKKSIIVCIIRPSPLLKPAGVPDGA